MQWNKIKLNQWIELYRVLQTHKIKHQTKYVSLICEPIKLSLLDCVRLSLAAKLNQTQSNGLYLIVFSD